MEKKLYRSRKEKKLCGVCGGIASYFKLDPTIVRLIWVLATLCAGVSVVLYIACALVIPEEPDDYVTVD